MDLANDTKKIAQVFPLMNKQTVSYRIKEQSSSKEQPILDEKENEINNEPGPSEVFQSQNPSRVQNQEWNIIENRIQSQDNQDWIQNNNQERNLQKNRDWNQKQSQSLTQDWNENQNQRTFPKLSSITLKPEHEQHPAYYYRSGSFNVQCTSPLLQPQPLPISQAVPQPQSQPPPSPFLKVQQIQSRTHSAELLIPMDQEDFRRSSFDNSPGFRRPGTGRKLPSTEHLEKPNLIKVGLIIKIKFYF